MIWFFAGGETNDNKFNVFTGSFIRLMKEIMGGQFDFVKGIFFKTSMMNVFWALNHAQNPVADPSRNPFIGRAFSQLIPDDHDPDTRLIIISSSTGSVIAAQTACYLAERSRKELLFAKPFHLALGASMVSTESELFRRLKSCQEEGLLGELIHDELQDDGDNTTGVGSTSRYKAWKNAIGLMMPWFSARYKRPSFLNIHPVNGHLHRRRSQTVKKAIDYIGILLVDKNLAGEYFREKAKRIMEYETSQG